MKLKKAWLVAIGTAMCLSMGGCSDSSQSGKREIEILSYKPEAIDTMQKIEDRFNETHDDIHLTISSPNQAMTILKTRLIREDAPDIVGIGGDINYSNFLDADLFEDISDVEAVSQAKEGYMDIEKSLELVEKEGTYALPFAANAAGILYNVEMFEEHGWQIPETWDEFIALCQTIKSEGITPLYFGFKDTWTTLAPWNALAVENAAPDVCTQVSKGNTTFEAEYKNVADKIKEMLEYCEPNPFAYSYNDAAIAFANGQAAMWPIGSYAIPQIHSNNPDLKIGSMVFPGTENAEDRILNSGVDLQFSIMKDCPDKEAAKEVLNFLYSDEILELYLEDQGGVSAKKGDFKIPENLSGMREFIESGNVADFHDHHYPSEMSVDAMIQTYLLDDSDQAATTFLQKFDKDWQRYNRELIRRLKEENAGN